MPVLFFLLFAPVIFAAETPITTSPTDKNLKWGPCPDIFPKGCELSILNSSEKNKNSDVFLKFPSDYKIPAHTHTSPEHMTLVSGTLDVKYKDKEKFRLETGSYAYGPAKHAHEARCVSKEPCILFINFDEPIDAKPYSGKL